MEIFTNPWVIAVGTAVIAGLILYFVFGIGKPKRKHKLDKPVTITQHNAQTALPSVSVGNANSNITIQQNIQQNTQAVPSVPVETQKSNLTPDEIYQYLQSLPPLQRDSAALNYKGIKVSWKVTLRGGFPQSSGELYLVTRDKNHNYIYCNVDPAQYPQIRVINSDQEFTVEGEIEKVNLVGDTTLINCRLLF